MAQHRYTEATSVVDQVPLDYKLLGDEPAEQVRMLDLIDRLSGLHAVGRSEGDLDPSEVDEWEASIAEHYDRPSTYISDMLCFHYERCRSPRTGWDPEGDNKARAPIIALQDNTTTGPSLHVYPNPAANWTTCDVTLVQPSNQARILLTDLLGRPLQELPVHDLRAKLTLDLRGLATGLYTIELLDGSKVLDRAKITVP